MDRPVDDDIAARRGRQKSMGSGGHLSEYPNNPWALRELVSKQTAYQNPLAAVAV